MRELLSILVIEGDPDDILFITSSLNKLQAKEIEAKISVATNLDEAVKALNDKEFDIIIADLFLPDSQGLETFLEVQKRADSIPIIIVGKSAEETLVRETIKLGAQDYLPKADLNVGLLSRIIRHAIERHRLHESLKALSFTDELTGVYNRRGFLTLLEQQISLARRTKKGFYLFLVDLDYLKQINDTYGHLVGDRALIDMANCLRASFRRHDIIGRIGGDEFAVVAINASVESGESLKQHMVDKVQDYNLLVKEPYKLTFGIGKAYYDGVREISLDELFQEADSELYLEKRLSHEPHPPGSP
jgi:two-component system, cell cycle response regulator